jgi:hypothetical protein
MAILGKENSQIEIRLYKLPLNGLKAVYFDEYAHLSKRDQSVDEVTRYIVPEDTSYGIEVIFKAGYVHGKYNGGHFLTLRDAASGAKIYKELW